MGSIKMIVEDKIIHCDKTKKDVNIHSLKHPIFKTYTTQVCDNHLSCKEKCKYKSE